MSARLASIPSVARQMFRAVKLSPQSTTRARPVPPLRQLHTSKPFRAQYERFDHRQTSGGPGRPGPDFRAFLRRRFGSDRVLYLYGIGLGGAGVYYVAHLERVPETGRLRFIDVSEASERQVRRLGNHQQSAEGSLDTRHSCKRSKNTIQSSYHPIIPSRNGSAKSLRESSKLQTLEESNRVVRWEL